MKAYMVDQLAMADRVMSAMLAGEGVLTSLVFGGKEQFYLPVMVAVSPRYKVCRRVHRPLCRRAFRLAGH